MFGRKKGKSKSSKNQRSLKRYYKRQRVKSAIFGNMGDDYHGWRTVGKSRSGSAGRAILGRFGRYG